MAERHEVRHVVVSARVKRNVVVHVFGRDVATFGSTQAAERFGVEHLRADPLPVATVPAVVR
ncbi:MAG TPA: hypothetical protein VGE74_12955 [Gemmata sp.]